MSTQLDLDDAAAPQPLAAPRAGNVPIREGLGPLVMPGQHADYCGQRWRVGAVGVTGGERYYWLMRWNIVLMAPATMVKPYIKRGLMARLRGPNVEVTCPPRAGHRSNDEHD